MILTLLISPVEYVTLLKLWMTLVVVAIFVMDTLVFCSFIDVNYEKVSNVKQHE